MDGLGRAGAVWEMSVRRVFEGLSKGVLSLSRIWGGGGISWRERGGDIGEKSGRYWGKVRERGVEEEHKGNFVQSLYQYRNERVNFLVLFLREKRAKSLETRAFDARDRCTVLKLLIYWKHKEIRSDKYGNTKRKRHTQHGSVFPGGTLGERDSGELSKKSLCESKTFGNDTGTALRHLSELWLKTDPGLFRYTQFFNRSRRGRDQRLCEIF